MPKTQTNTSLRALPSVDSLLRTETAQSIRPRIGASRLSSLARRITDELRREMLAVAPEKSTESTANGSRASLLREAERRLAAAHAQETSRGVRRVINATGVVLHTNLGRAPLSDAARRAIADTAAGYCSLEYDIASGERGRRGPRAEDLLADLTGAEAALVVNNCAAAALLVLTTLAREAETIVSRGELVEIGGDFRVPDVMAQSGTQMIEVGTTNRTRLSDYRKAISENTRLIMRVHASNYRIIGFTKTPTVKELAGLAHDAGLILYEDAGSGALLDFTEYGIDGEPVVRRSIEAGADVVSFSGDKLLGGPQAGLLVGRADIIERMRSHPLYRAVRADKLRIAALEATLDAYARGASESEVPAHRFIALSADEIKKRAVKMIRRLRGRIPDTVELNTVPGESAAGGGSGPTSRLPTVLISIAHKRSTPNQIEATLRRAEPPVIARIVDDRVLLDLRTVAESEEPELARAILSLPP
ncbi:MAG TPA: L-seryl-tRNA(Sec) selenium transferase [Pyrinomonadaceae bacterium]|nr:L-seryl-tRNA(Sec) selenium transferase [Pyrinomonadaceae bacterium]